MVSGDFLFKTDSLVVAFGMLHFPLMQVPISSAQLRWSKTVGLLS